MYISFLLARKSSGLVVPSYFSPIKIPAVPHGTAASQSEAVLAGVGCWARGAGRGIKVSWGGEISHSVLNL